MTDNNPAFRMTRTEFVALIAMMFATIAFSTDAMLPALPEIAEELSAEVVNRAPLILSSFVLGMGIGTIIAGPLSDAYGRRRIIVLGALLYIVASAVAYFSATLEIMLAARLVQGLGAAGPRIVSVAIVRDLFAGRDMAKIVSLVMLIFTMVPAIAPLLGSVIIDAFGWRAIFLAFILFSLITLVWMGLRLPETLDPAERRPIKLSLMGEAIREMFQHPSVRLSIMVQTLAMAMLFSILMMVQPIYYEIFDRADTFVYWFGGVAILSGSASLLNAVLVGRFGMRLLVTVTLGCQMVLSAAMYLFDLGALPGTLGFGFFVFWQICLFFQAGLTLGNLNAIAMEPMGHIAGLAASVIGAVSTILAAILASPVALLFNGTLEPITLSICVMATAGFLLMLRMGRLERQLIDMAHFRSQRPATGK